MKMQDSPDRLIRTDPFDLGYGCAGLFYIGRNKIFRI